MQSISISSHRAEKAWITRRQNIKTEQLVKTLEKWQSEVIVLMKKRQKEKEDVTYQSGYLNALYHVEEELKK